MARLVRLEKAPFSAPSVAHGDTVGFATRIFGLAILAFAAASCAGKPSATVNAGVGSAVPSDAGTGPSTANPFEGLDVAVATVAKVVAPDMTAEGFPFKEMLAPGGRAQIGLTLAAGRCYAIVGVSKDGAIDELGLELLSAPLFTTPIAQGVRQPKVSVLGPTPAHLCIDANAQGAFKLDVIAARGSGPVAVQLFAKANGTATATTPAGTDNGEAALKSAQAKLAPGMEAEGPPTTQRLETGGHFGMSVNLVGGKCYTLLAASPQGAITDVEMTLLMPPFFTVPVESDKRTDNVAAIGGGATPQCPITPVPIPYKVDVAAKKGSGPFTFQLFSKTKK
ncbi:MAG: hypothetical protein U0169_21570 [Polyangiaceae bacterium]